MAGYNLVVDSNVTSPSTYAPSVATVGGCFCNKGDATLTNVQAFIGNLYLGSGAPGADGDGQPDAAATGDDSHGSDDENGIVRNPGDHWTAGATVRLTATVTGSNGYLVAFFDWNGDGDFGEAQRDHHLGQCGGGRESAQPDHPWLGQLGQPSQRPLPPVRWAARLGQPAGRGEQWRGRGLSTEGWSPLAGVEPGSAAIVKNIYARLDASRSTVVANGDKLTVTWAVWFTAKSSGRLNKLYLRVEDRQGSRDGWNDRGDWAVNVKPTTPYLSPAEGTMPLGQWQEFQARYGDADGRATLAEVYLLITDATGRTQNAVYLKYDKGENKLYLRNAADTAWLPGITPKVAGSVENEYCILRGDWTRPATYDAQTLTLRWWLQFKPAFAGRHNIYVRAVDNLGAAWNGDTGWRYKGGVEVR